MFTGTTTLNANGDEQKTSGSKFKRELSNMSEKQASQIQIAIWVIGGLCLLILTITGASLGYVLNEINKNQDNQSARIAALEKVSSEARIKKIEEEQIGFREWIKEHDDFSRDQVLKINNNLARIAAKLNVELKQ